MVSGVCWAADGAEEGHNLHAHSRNWFVCVRVCVRARDRVLETCLPTDRHTDRTKTIHRNRNYLQDSGRETRKYLRAGCLDHRVLRPHRLPPARPLSQPMHASINVSLCTDTHTHARSLAHTRPSSSTQTPENKQQTSQRRQPQA